MTVSQMIAPLVPAPRCRTIPLRLSRHPGRISMDELQHECGVAALYYLPGHAEPSTIWTGDPGQVSRLMPRMLLDLQNRGQLAAGMSTFNPTRPQIIDTWKEVGSVAEAFRTSH